MMDSALVSVIIPTFNRAHCLPKAIDSALAQTHQQMEIIIIDDGSTDDTQRLIAERYSGDRRVRYIVKKNGGVASARNLGIAESRGEFIALLDSDDIWTPWKLELQLACMRQRPDIGMVWTDMEAVNEVGEMIHPRFLRKMYHAWRHFTPEGLFGEGQLLSQVAARSAGPLAADLHAGGIAAEARFYWGNVFSPMLMGSLVHTSTVLMRRERLERVKEFNIAFTPIGEDYDFHLRTCREGNVGFIDLPTMRYQTGLPDQLTRREYKLHVAVNCLRTITPWLQDRAAIDLPEQMIRSRLAGVHEWVAQEMLDHGDCAGCRRHCLLSLRHGPWQKRGWKLLVASCLPQTCVKWLRRRSLRRNVNYGILLLLMLHVQDAMANAAELRWTPWSAS